MDGVWLKKREFTMRINYTPIILPFICMSVLFIAQILFIIFIGTNGYGSTFTIVSLPSDLALFIAAVYSVWLIKILPPDLMERKFWVWVSTALFAYSIGVLLRMYVLTLFSGAEVIISYVQFLYIASMVIVVLAIAKLINDLGVPIGARVKRWLFLLGILLCVALFCVFIPQIMSGDLEIVVILTSSVISILCALIVPLAIMLHLSIGRGVLRIPFFYIMLAAPMLATQTSALVFMNVKGLPNATLQPHFIIPYMLFCTFVLIAMSTRAHIAKMLDKGVDGSHRL